MPRKVSKIAPPGFKYCPHAQHRGPNPLPLGDFNGGYCKDCYRKYHRKWANETREAMVKDMMEDAVAQYGGECIGCGEKRQAILSIVPQGKHGRRQHLYALRKAGWPEMTPEGEPIVLMCQNCLTIHKSAEKIGEDE
jgi:hypothetical protein